MQLCTALLAVQISLSSLSVSASSLCQPESGVHPSGRHLLQYRLNATAQTYQVFIADADGGVTQGSMTTDATSTSTVLNTSVNTFQASLQAHSTYALGASISRAACGTVEVIGSPSTAVIETIGFYNPPSAFYNNRSILIAGYGDQNYIAGNITVQPGASPKAIPLNSTANNTLLGANPSGIASTATFLASYRPAGKACTTSFGNDGVQTDPVLLVAQSRTPIPSNGISLTSIYFSNATCIGYTLSSSNDGNADNISITASATLSIVGQQGVPGDFLRQTQILNTTSLTGAPGFSTNYSYANGLNETGIYKLSTSGFSVSKNNITVALQVAMLSSSNSDCGAQLTSDLKYTSSGSASVPVSAPPVPVLAPPRPSPPSPLPMPPGPSPNALPIVHVPEYRAGPSNTTYQGSSLVLVVDSSTGATWNQSAPYFSVYSGSSSDKGILTNIGMTGYGCVTVNVSTSASKTANLNTYMREEQASAVLPFSQCHSNCSQSTPLSPQHVYDIIIANNDSISFNAGVGFATYQKGDKVCQAALSSLSSSNQSSPLISSTGSSSYLASTQTVASNIASTGANAVATFTNTSCLLLQGLAFDTGPSNPYYITLALYSEQNLAGVLKSNPNPISNGFVITNVQCTFAHNQSTPSGTTSCDYSQQKGLTVTNLDSAQRYFLLAQSSAPAGVILDAYLVMAPKAQDSCSGLSVGSVVKFSEFKAQGLDTIISTAQKKAAAQAAQVAQLISGAIGISVLG